MKFIKEVNYNYSDDDKLLEANVVYMHDNGVLESVTIKGKENLIQLNKAIAEQQKGTNK